VRRATAAAAVLVALVVTAFASGATRVDGSVTVDLVGAQPRVGVPFTATVVMSGTRGQGGNSYDFTVVVRLSSNLVFLRASNPFQAVPCAQSDQTITCRGRVFDVEFSTNIDFSLRATSAGAATVDATLTVDSSPDTNPQNNTAQLVVSVLGAPTSTKRVGTERNDVLRGTSRNDQLYGLGGADLLSGLAGDDLLDGGRGNDRLFGGPGRDRLFGGPGNDTINSVDGQRDSVNCGAGRDTAVVDRLDRVAGCERVQRRS
jgi:Ca2+-binding RTX toxin-like protein